MTDNSKSVSLLYFFSFVLAFCSLAYELLIAQTVSTLAANTVIWFSVTVGLYLCAMGMGSFYCHRLTQKTNALKVLVSVEIFLSLLGCLVVAFIHGGHMFMSFFWAREWFGVGLVAFFFIYGAGVVLIGFLTGLEIPLLIGLGRDMALQNFKTNRLLASDYFGSLVAGLVFPLVFIPFFNLFSIGAFVALLNIMMAGALLIFFLKQQKSFPLVRVGMVFVFVLFCFLSAGRVEQYFLKKYYYYKDSAENLSTLFAPMSAYPTPKRIRSPYQTIDLVRLAPYAQSYRDILKSYSSKLKTDGSVIEDRGLYINGAFQLWSNFEELYHEYFAHVPLMLNKQAAADVLVLGAGDGMLVRELLKYSTIKKITIVELDPEMINAAKNEVVLTSANKNALDDPRVEVIIRDAYHYLKTNTHQYDAVYMDFPDPQNFDLSKLYSREFYSFVYRSLSAQGFAVCNALRLGLSVVDEAKKTRDPYEHWQAYFATLKAAGFKTIVPFSSRLELDNVEARQIFRETIGDAQELVVRENSVMGGKEKIISGPEAIVTQLLKDFTEDYTQRFIFVKKEKVNLDFQYQDPKIELFILNEKRFNLAFDRDFDSDQYQDHALVNSILHPTMPDLSYWWRVKLPHR
ncbi:spermidine synthase [Candidatus Omnitrophota bacterium]